MSDTPSYLSARSGWTLTILLTIAYIFSYIDRSILGCISNDNSPPVITVGRSQ